MSTEFAKQFPPAAVGGAVRFVLLIEGRQNQTYEISTDVLVERFGARSRSDDDLLEAFRRGKNEIIAIAAQSTNTPVNDVVQLGTGDFAESPGKEL